MMVSDMLWEKCWFFDTPLMCLPKFPYVKAGTVKSSKGGALFYIVDSDAKVWIGVLDKFDDNMIRFKYFEYELALDLVFNLNILTCFEIDNIIRAGCVS